MSASTSYQICNAHALAPRCGARALSLRCSSSKREAKDPSKFKNMDAAREHLMSQHAGPSFSSFLNWMSEGAFGASGSSKGLPAIYRMVLQSRWAKSLQSNVHKRPGYVPPPDDLFPALEQDQTAENRRRTAAEHSAVSGSAPTLQPLSERDMSQTQLRRLDEIAVVTACERRALLYVVREYPAILDMDPAAIMQRLLDLKAALPGCNVMLLLELDPARYIGASQSELKNELPRAYSALKQQLPGVDINELLSVDPSLPFFSHLFEGLWQVRAEWDLPALQDAEPSHLALIIRSAKRS